MSGRFSFRERGNEFHRRPAVPRVHQRGENLKEAGIWIPSLRIDGPKNGSRRTAKNARDAKKET
jgi:hypothetical protein